MIFIRRNDIVRMGARYLPWLIIFLICSGLAIAIGGPTFRYTNPIQTEPIRDAQITKVGDTWYMTGTSLDKELGVKIWSSQNLTDWRLESQAIRPSEKHWYKKRFWAPELFPYKNKWYLTFNCPQGDEPDSPQFVALAVADKITGPYQVVTEDKPLTEGNDATLFQDDDGKVYLFRSGISGIQVDLPTATTVGSSFNVISPGGPTAWDGTAPGGPGVGVEGPSVLKHGGTYYLLYASWGRGYEEGYATSQHITGPWEKYQKNPVYGAQDEEWCKRYKHLYTQSSNIPYGQVAHGSPFIGPDGTVWFGCHGYLKGVDQQPHLIISPVAFDRHGIMHMSLTWTPQSAVVPQPFRLALNGTRLASPVIEQLAAGR